MKLFFSWRMITITAFLFSVVPLPVWAQQKTLSGYVKDSTNGESIIAATIYLKEADLGVQTNNYGFYSISAKPGIYTLIISYVGFSTRTQTIDLTSDKTLNIELRQTTEMKEVEVVATRKDENVKNAEMGTITLSMARIKTLPVIFGEVDILKSLQLLPGVQSAGDGLSGFYVRGGGPDENLMLLDDAVVYNTGHLFGFFSVFNSDAIKDVTLIKGDAPANYGGRLSSVVDVTMKEGNMKEFHGEGGIGLIASRLALEGPIKKNKGSFIVAGRRTYIDVLAKPFSGGRLKNSGYYFYDLNLKANYILGNKDRLYLSAYMGLDKFTFSNQTGTFKAVIPWGNKIATLRWNHQFSKKIFANTSLIYTNYNFQSTFTENSVENSSNAFGVKIASGITDYNLKTDFDYYATNKQHFKAGYIYTLHTFVPNQVSGQADTIKLDPKNPYTKYANEGGLYLLDDIDITDKFKINVGIRYSVFQQIGPYTQYNFNAAGTATDSTKYGTSKPVVTYGGWEPRLNLRYTLDDNSSVKAGVAKTYQYVHLVTNNGSTLPTDVWVPSTDIVKPEKSWQYSAGYFRNFLENKLETSLEVYYKDMSNLIQYKDGYVPNTIQDPQYSYIFGKGNSYGAELFINKTRGKFTGWIGYTLSWTTDQFTLLNNGNPFPAKYDRRHDLSLVGTYEINKKWTISSVFIYATGNSITLPTAIYFVNNNPVQQYSKVNGYRLPAYHRMDISANYTPKHKHEQKWQGSWSFSVYNVYDKHNPFFLYVDTQGSLQTNITIKTYEVYIFPIIPSITYNFKF